MDAHTDIQSTQGGVTQHPMVKSLSVDREHEPGNTGDHKDLVPDNLNSPPSDVHLNFVTDAGDIETNETRGPIRPFKSDPEPSDTQTVRNGTDREHDCMQSQSNSSDQVVLAAIHKEAPPSDCVVFPAGGFTPSQPPLLRARAVSPITFPRDKRGADADDHSNSNCIQALYPEPDHVCNADLACLTDEEEIRETFDLPFGDLPSSLPPSSSPPQLFSSSPYGSSQSSISGTEPSQKVMAVEVEDCASFHDRPHGDYVLLVAQDESCLEFKNLSNHDSADVGRSPGSQKEHSQVGSTTSCIEGGFGAPSKRIVYQNDPDESYGSQPIKRPKLDSCLYLPPAPKRPTLVSQHLQFKKLAAPFRPPLKLPGATDGLAQTVNNKEAESTVNTTLATGHDKIDVKGSTQHFPLQYKASNTSRSATQFKSPLVNRALPAESRPMRLTPALQALERKLQLLKRAIKVKEDKEEQDLTRLAGKWIEAGREVAYDVWDATKDAGDLEGKVTYNRRSYGWESNSDVNMPWGWNTKPDEAGEESRDYDPSAAPCTVGRPAPEEDDDIGSNTLGTMLRQLGIAPEIFGWDDERVTFSD